MKEYIITFKTSYQIAPDDWNVINPTLKVNELTTVSEIDLFFRTHIPNGNLEVRLIQLETPIQS